jgi:3-dehydroquinate synthase
VHNNPEKALCDGPQSLRPERYEELLKQISKIAEKKGLMPLGITDEIRKMVKKYGLPDDYQPWDEALLFKALTHDKKARGTIIKTVIVPEIGTAKINEVTFEEMKEYLKK